MKITRKETSNQMTEDKRQNELRLQEHIQRLEAREDRKKRRTLSKHSCGDGRRRHDHGYGGRRNSLLKRQPLLIKIIMFKGDNDSNIYSEWDKKMDQIFNVHLVSDQH